MKAFFLKEIFFQQIFCVCVKFFSSVSPYYCRVRKNKNKEIFACDLSGKFPKLDLDLAQHMRTCRRD